MAEPKKVFDVAKPGDTSADSTSRPLIVGHKNTMQHDPMVAGSDDQTAPVVKDMPVVVDDTPVSTQGKTIKPRKIANQDGAKAHDTNKTHTMDISVTDDQPVVVKVTKESPSEEKQDAPSASPDDTETETKPPDNTSADNAAEDTSENEGATGVVAGQAAQKKEDAKAEEVQAAQQEAVRALADSKQYFVPIGEAKRRRSAAKVLSVLVLVFIIAAAAAYAAIDAGLIDTNITLPYDFIKN